MQILSSDDSFESPCWSKLSTFFAGKMHTSFSLYFNEIKKGVNRILINVFESIENHQPYVHLPVHDILGAFDTYIFSRHRILRKYN